MTEDEKLLAFLLLTDKIAERSKDNSTQVGAIFLNKNETAPRCFGYNGMPRGLDDNNRERLERPEKYFWFEHAERNGIYNGAREILDNKTIISTFFPTMESARAIVSTGIKKVVVLREKIEDLDMYRRVTTLFKETNVELVQTHKDYQSEIESYKHNLSIEEIDKLISLHHKYMQNIEFLNEYALSFSPSRDRKEAAMILNEKTFAPIENGFGVNSPPEVLKYITEEMHTEKNYWFQDAIKNAVFNSVREKFDGCTVVASWCPCIDCSLAITAVGAKKVVTREIDFTHEADQRWKESFGRTQHLYKTAGIELKLFNVKRPELKPQKLKRVRVK